MKGIASNAQKSRMPAKVMATRPTQGHATAPRDAIERVEGASGPVSIAEAVCGAGVASTVIAVRGVGNL
jgi:hypothetical protein